jgi:hypothetical protein
MSGTFLEFAAHRACGCILCTTNYYDRTYSKCETFPRILDALKEAEATSRERTLNELTSIIKTMKGTK